MREAEARSWIPLCVIHIDLDAECGSKYVLWNGKEWFRRKFSKFKIVNDMVYFTKPLMKGTIVCVEMNNDDCHDCHGKPAEAGDASIKRNQIA